MALVTYLRPITAVTLVQLDRLYVLTAEGEYIKIFDYGTGNVVARAQVFASQSIHGLCQLTHQLATEHHEEGKAIAVIWGGRSVCVIRLSKEIEEIHGERLTLQTVIHETRLDDWILDACFRPLPLAAERYHANSNNQSPLLITAHNDLLTLVNHGGRSSRNHGHVPQYLCSGPNSMLCSAHVCFTSEGRIAVASGSVTGEIYVWTTLYPRLKESTATSEILYTFQAHEGTIFGIRMSQQLKAIGGPARMLLSCSDDRTIRLWDISDIDTSTPGRIPTGDCLANTMGHASRIWKVGFLHGHDGATKIISAGEDGTAQLWSIEPSARGMRETDDRTRLKLTLHHEKTWAYHAGKNLWSLASISKGRGMQMIATGGSDGRVTSYRMEAKNASEPAGLARYTVPQIFQSARLQEAKFAEHARPVESIFNAMSGQWKLSRRIESAMPPYPSGSFNGLATLETRGATDPSYEKEYLYHEEGEFVSDQGLTFKATKQYVYRYQKNAEKISAWFVKQDGKTVDYHFHDLSFTEGLSRNLHTKDTKRLTASGHHLCTPDTYGAEYHFQYLEDHLTSWNITYTVKGPQKDYVSNANYSLDPAKTDSSSSETMPQFSAPDRFLRNQPSKFDSLKAYAWISAASFLATTEQGFVLLATRVSKSGVLTANGHRPDDSAEEHMNWSIVAENEDLSSNSMISGRREAST